jgi:ABC-2 type transport system permease protein
MVAAQARIELLTTLRRGESVVVTVLIPALLLVFFTSSRVLAVSGLSQVEFLLPGMLALAVVSTGFVSLGIATAFERHYGTLKLLGATPLPRAGLVAAKAVAVVAIEAAQVALLTGIALLYGWHLRGSAAHALLALALGTCAFTGLGLAMAGALRAETTLAVANGGFLVLLLVSGIVLPLSHLPAWLAAVGRVLPAAPLAEVLRATLSTGAPPSAASLALLAGWAVLGPILAVRRFRWE